MILITCVLVLVALASARLEAKMRNGPPTTFKEHRLPEVAHESEHENSRLFEATGTWDGKQLTWVHGIACDSTGL
jgi:hypothetical protein